MEQKKQRNKLALLFHWLLVLISLVSGLLLIVSCFSSVVDPRDSNWIPVLGLGLHILIFINILWLFYWILRTRIWLFVPLVALLCSLGHMGDYYQISMTKEYALEDRAKLDTLTLASYNVAGFRYLLDSERRAQSVDSIGAYLHSQKVDVIFMQEYLDRPKDSTSLYEEIFADWPYSEFMKLSSEYKLHKGLIIRSRYPIRNAHCYYFKGTTTAFMSVDLVRTKGDTITVFNCHLQSTGFNQMQPKGLTDLVEREDREEAMIKLNEGLNTNYKKRAQQVDSLRYVIDSLREKRIVVAGDFNDTPNSWAVTTVRGDDFLDSFKEVGSGYGYSYRPMKRLFRIDYILYKEEFFEALEYTSAELPWSDHNPVVVKLVVKDLDQNKE